jgi:putative tricarboxylic transport membrane protein
LLAGLLAALSVWYLARPGEAEAWPRGRTLVRVVTLLGLVFLGAWLYDRAGFVAATVIMCAGIALLFRATPLQALLCGLGNAALFWLLFVPGLGIPLPVGRWWAGLGG